MEYLSNVHVNCIIIKSQNLQTSFILSGELIVVLNKVFGIMHRMLVYISYRTNIK